MLDIVRSKYRTAPILFEVVTDTTVHVVSRSTRYSGHDRRVRCICY